MNIRSRSMYANRGVSVHLLDLHEKCEEIGFQEGNSVVYQGAN
jgi:hypothetical protein